MLCALGTDLLLEYQTAARDRDTAKDILLVSSVRRFQVAEQPFEELMFIVKQRYSRAFVDWVTHRQGCVHCRAVYGRDDQIEFASV
jgi:hypothetical protein